MMPPCLLARARIDCVPFTLEEVAEASAVVDLGEEGSSRQASLRSIEEWLRYCWGC